MGVPNKLLTLVFALNGNKVLLGYKKRGFGVGRWNGFGGKVDKNESILDGAKREMFEESTLVCNHLEECGRIDFEFVGEEQILEVHIFRTNVFEGKPTETEEMRPKWFDVNEIPFGDMWPDDELWFPYLLSGSKFKGYFLFEGMDKILKKELNVVESL